MAVRFDGKVAVVTGAGGGLGKLYALALASRGAKVVVNDLGGGMDGSGGSDGPARMVCEEIRKAGGEAFPNFEDISSPEGTLRIAGETVDRFGAVDILINNAGILRDKTFAKMDPADFRKVVEVHLFGTVNMTRAVYPVMQRKGYGRIVFVTSSAGLFGNFGQTNYSAAKSGIVGFMNALKLEAGKFNILANAVAPVAATRMGEQVFPPDVLPLLDPAQVVPLVLYLASDACPFSGKIMTAAGGRFSTIQVMEGEGLRFPPGKTVTPEDIEEKIETILEIKDPKSYGSALEEVLDILQALRKPFPE